MADNLYNELSKLNMGVTSVTPANVTMFNVVNRTINIPVEVKDIVVEGDTNSKKITFEMSRYFDGVDLSSKTIKIKYKNAAGGTGVNETSNVLLDFDTFTFDWILTSEVSAVAGKAAIQVECSEVNESLEIIYVWQTKPVEFDVEEGLLVFNDAVPYDDTYQSIFLDSYGGDVNYNDISDTDPVILVDNRDILIYETRDLVVESDTRSQIISFRIPRYIDNVDLSEKAIAIKFRNALGQGDRVRVVNKIVSDNEITFGWLIDNKVTVKEGLVYFAIEILGKNEKDELYVWSTKPAAFNVEKGLNVEDMEVPPSSLIQSWIVESQEAIDNFHNNTEGYYQDIINSANTVQQAMTDVAENAGIALESAISATQASSEVYEMLSKAYKGKSVTLGDMSFSDFMKISVFGDSKYGNISQSKNLFKANDLIDERGIAITYDVLADEYIINGVCNSVGYINLTDGLFEATEGETYSLSVWRVSGSISDSVSFAISGTYAYFSFGNNDTYKYNSKTYESSDYKTVYVGITVDAGVVFDNFRIRIQLEKDSPTDWQPYGGLIYELVDDLPSPTNPLDIVPVTGKLLHNDSPISLIPSLYGVINNDTLYAQDELNIKTGEKINYCDMYKITGNETITDISTSTHKRYAITLNHKHFDNTGGFMCSHFVNSITQGLYSQDNSTFVIVQPNGTPNFDTVANVKAWLTNQNNSGKPVTILHVLQVPVVEDYNPQVLPEFNKGDTLTTDCVVQPDLEVVYKRDITGMAESLENILSVKSMTQDEYDMIPLEEIDYDGIYLVG